MTRAPTVSRASTRLMLSIAASHPDKILKSRDPDQAYTQSETPVSRKVLCEVPKGLGLDDSWVLVLVRPLYGLGEAGLHWFLTFFRYHKEDLGLSPTSLDLCLLYKRDKNEELQALVSVQVDDSLAVGDAYVFCSRRGKGFSCSAQTSQNTSQKFSYCIQWSNYP
jgi:hypothetical protein